MLETALSAISEGTPDKIKDKLFETSQKEFLGVLQKDLLEDYQKKFLERFKTIQSEELPYKIVRKNFRRNVLENFKSNSLWNLKRIS